MKPQKKSAQGAAASSPPSPRVGAIDLNRLAAHPAIQSWLDDQIAKSDLELKLGPYCLGWAWGNEAKREGIQAVNDFLHTLAATSST